MDLTYRIQGWDFVHAQPPDLSRGAIFCSLLFQHSDICIVDVVAYLSGYDVSLWLADFTVLRQING